MESANVTEFKKKKEKESITRFCSEQKPQDFETKRKTNHHPIYVLAFLNTLENSICRQVLVTR